MTAAAMVPQTVPMRGTFSEERPLCTNGRFQEEETVSASGTRIRNTMLSSMPARRVSESAVPAGMPSRTIKAVFTALPPMTGGLTAAPSSPPMTTRMSSG